MIHRHLQMRRLRRRVPQRRCSSLRRCRCPWSQSRCSTWWLSRSSCVVVFSSLAPGSSRRPQHPDGEGDATSCVTPHRLRPLTAVGRAPPPYDVALPVPRRRRSTVSATRRARFLFRGVRVGRRRSRFVDRGFGFVAGASAWRRCPRYWRIGRCVLSGRHRPGIDRFIAEDGLAGGWQRIRRGRRNLLGHKPSRFSPLRMSL